MAEVKIKIDIHLNTEHIKKALKKRGIAVNEANTKRFINMIKGRSLSVTEEFYDNETMDRETLLMYGFTFERKKEKSQ